MEEISFNHLKRVWNLKVVVEAGSISKAALRMNVTNSAMSQSISGLETALGKKLLLRNPEAAVPTEYGLNLLKLAAPAFESFSRFQKSLDATPKACPAIAWLDFAVTESLALDVLPPLMKRLRSQLPNLRLKVKSGDSPSLTKLVKNGKLCMALVEENDGLSAVNSAPVAEDRLGFFVSRDKNIQLFRSKEFKKIGVGVIAPPPEGYPRYFTRFLNANMKGLKPTLVSNSYELLRAAAVEGSIVAILPTRVTHRTKDELAEIFRPASRDAQTTCGAYKIYLVSEPTCTTEENEFLANEIKSVLKGYPSVAG